MSKGVLYLIETEKWKGTSGVGTMQNYGLEGTSNLD